MKLLREFKNNHAISSDLVALLISSLEIQLLGMFLINKNLSIYQKILEFIS